MKSFEILPKILNAASILTVTTGLMLVGSPAFAGGNGPVKGASLLMQSKPAVETPAAATPATATMNCPKCKNAVVTRTLNEKGQFKTTVSVMRHLCPSCEQKTGVTGVGKNAQVSITHVCAENQASGCMAQK